jgi:Spherulation-specific family 4
MVMPFSGSLIRRVFGSAIASMLITSFTASPAQASLGALVPAYFSPGTGGANNVGDGWTQMADAAHVINLTAIFNPNNGPVPGPDPNPDYVNAITALESAGGHVVAYVPTAFGTRPLSAVEADIQTYLAQYGGLIGGFFIDQMTTGTSGLSYYHSLYTYIKALGSSLQDIGNPGSITDSGYLAPATRAADTLVTFENYASNYPAYTPPPWAFQYPSSAFGNILHTQPSVAGMLADVALARGNHVGDFFETDLSLPNPYQQLPSYWDQEVAALATPEPGSLTALGLAGVVGVALLAVNRLRKRRIW